MTAHASDIRHLETPIPTPHWVRLGASLLIGAAVAVLVSDVHFGIAIGVGLLFLIAAFTLVFLHPYRTQLRAYADKKNVTMLPNISQLIPLMLLWLIVMLAPLFTLPAWGVAVTWLLISGAAFFVFPPRRRHPQASFVMSSDFLDSESIDFFDAESS